MAVSNSHSRQQGARRGAASPSPYRAQLASRDDRLHEVRQAGLCSIQKGNAGGKDNLLRQLCLAGSRRGSGRFLRNGGNAASLCTRASQAPNTCRTPSRLSAHRKGSVVLRPGTLCAGNVAHVAKRVDLSAIRNHTTRVRGQNKQKIAVLDPSALPVPRPSWHRPTQYRRRSLSPGSVAAARRFSNSATKAYVVLS